MPRAIVRLSIVLTVFAAGLAMLVGTVAAHGGAGVPQSAREGGTVLAVQGAPGAAPASRRGDASQTALRPAAPRQTVGPSRDCTTTAPSIFVSHCGAPALPVSAAEAASAICHGCRQPRPLRDLAPGRATSVDLPPPRVRFQSV
ncbi:hypothetical protein [Stappia sp.]|uniref:hypothetical protein n=1 Tax=Stappia sp. TaxID=1870903 RepID=UPI0032D98C92